MDWRTHDIFGQIPEYANYSFRRADREKELYLARDGHDRKAGEDPAFAPIQPWLGKVPPGRTTRYASVDLWFWAVRISHVDV